MSNLLSKMAVAALAAAYRTYREGTKPVCNACKVNEAIDKLPAGEIRDAIKNGINGLIARAVVGQPKPGSSVRATATWEGDGLKITVESKGEVSVAQSLMAMERVVAAIEAQAEEVDEPDTATADDGHDQMRGYVHEFGELLKGKGVDARIFELDLTGATSNGKG